ncbi:hypothetical protein GW17_00034910 [Ensete ventricosum]|nr:hypothetical protein GW17_00034910 [Ensete ventricosum]
MEQLSYSGSDDEVGPRQEFTRRFAEGIGKLARNTLGDRRKKTKRLIVRMSEATVLAGILLGVLPLFKCTGGRVLSPSASGRGCLPRTLANFVVLDGAKLLALPEAAHTIDNVLLILSVGETEALERIQKFFSTDVMEREEKTHSVEATPPSALSKVASEQLVSLLLAPTTPSLEAVAPYVRPSTEEGPTPPLPPTRVGPYVNSLAPLLGPLVAMSLRGEAVDWPFTP